jgi:3-oxoacyl-[acyl-carrier protein] reductase/(S)-1-phenylethanol dehydrogenase
MSKDKEGAVAVVTGAAAGIGQGCAVRLAEEGAKVALLDIGDASETQRQITDAGGQAITVQCDVSDPQSVEAAAASVKAELGTATILANIAGIYPNAPFENVTFEDWRQVMAINLDGSFLTCKAFAPGMVEAGKGRIVNISSSVIALNVPWQVPYFASKMGVIGLTRALANDLGMAGDITVNAIAPGVIHTPHVIEMAEGTPLFEMTEVRQAIKRGGEIADVVAAVSYLTSPAASFVTGQTLTVDGGIMRV